MRRAKVTSPDGRDTPPTKSDAQSDSSVAAESSSTVNTMFKGANFGVTLP